MLSSTDPIEEAGAMLGYQVLAAELRAVGVDTLFGVMGDSNLSWLTEWALMAGSDYVSARHESGAIAMADGFARESGDVGVSTTTFGPGLLNAMNALATATRGGWGHVLLTGSTPLSVPFHIQRYDQRALVEALGARYVRVEQATQIRSAVQTIFAVARETRCSVVVDFADEVFTETCDVDQEWQWPDKPELAEAGELDFDAAVALLREAKSPVVLAGAGAELSGAVLEAVKLAELTGAYLATTLITRGLFADHPAYLGVFGGFSTPWARKVIEDADVIVVIGAGLNDYTTDRGRLLEGSQVLQIDWNPEAIGRERQPHLSLQGDARTVLSALNVVLQAEGAQLVEVEAVPEEARVLRADHDESDSTGIDPRTAMSAIDARLPANRAIVIDGGHFIEWPSRYLSAPTPRSFRAAVAGGSIALALAHGLGMARSGRAEAYVAVMGDGGFFMALTELETAVREGIPLIVAVINDAAYSAEVHKLVALGLPDDLSYFDEAPDIVELARATGADAFTVQAPNDVDRLPDLTALEKPLVLDLRVTRAVASSRLAVKPG